MVGPGDASLLALPAAVRARGEPRLRLLAARRRGPDDRRRAAFLLALQQLGLHPDRANGPGLPLLCPRHAAVELGGARSGGPLPDGRAFHRPLVRADHHLLVLRREREVEARLGDPARVCFPRLRLRRARDRPAAAGGAYAPTGSRTMKREPWPGSESTSSRPFMRPTSSRQM